MDRKNHDTKKRLESLHPARVEKIPDLPKNAKTYSISNDKKFREFIRNKFINGKGAGPSGWSAEILLPLIKCKQVMDALVFFLSDFRNGRLPDRLKQYLLPANILAFAKEKSPNPRPIAVGEIFYRLVTAYTSRTLGKSLPKSLLPIQLGVGVEGGVETVHHFLSASLTDSNLNLAAISADQKNAFNSRERAKMLSALYDHDLLEPLWRLAD